MKILVLDSDKGACELLVRTLQGFFPEHEWQTAFSYEEGRSIAEKGERLDFILADLKTNEAGGPSLAHLFEGISPDVQVYFLGNWSQETTFFRARPGRTFARPVNVHEVVAAIHLAEENLALRQTDPAPTATNPPAGGLERINRLLAHEGFTGQLAQFQLHEIVQMCCLGQRTGRMTVTNGGEHGSLYFHEGRLLHGECGNLSGEPAVSKIIGWKSGQFAFADGLLADRETIQTSWDFLLLETMRQMDEAAAEGKVTMRELKEGQCFGPYQLVRRIALREQEHVFEAQLSLTGLTVNLHVLPQDSARTSAEVKRFVAEAAAKSELDNPAFLRATKAAHTEGVYFFTSEHFDASRVDALGAGRHLTETQVLDVLRVVAHAMGDLQSQHLLHHPLLPRHVLIDSTGRVRLENLATLRNGTSLPVASQIEGLAAALINAVGPDGVRSSALKRVLRRIQRAGPDQISSWASLRKAVEGISANALVAGGLSDEHTSFVVNLVPDRPTRGVLKLAAAAGFAGLMLGTLLWANARVDHANARERTPATDLPATIAPVEPGPGATNPVVTAPRVYSSINELVESAVAESTAVPQRAD